MTERAADLELIPIRKTMASGRHAEAGAMIDVTLRDEPDHATALYLKARLGVATEETDGVELYFARAVALRPFDMEFRYFYAELLFSQRRLQGAIDLLDVDSKHTRFNADALVLLGRSLRLLGRPEEALQRFEKARNYSGFFAISVLEQSRCHLDCERPKEAIEVLREALVQAPDDATLKEALAGALGANDSRTEADRLLAEVSGGTEDPFDAAMRIGAELFEKSDTVRAIAYWEVALKVRPDNASALTNIGVGYRTLRKYDVALDYLRKALALDANNTATLNTIGNVFFDKDLKPQAVEAFKRAVALKPDFAMAYANCSRSLFDLKRFDEAVAFAAKAIHMKELDAGSVMFPMNVLQRAAAFDELDYLNKRIWDMVDEMPPWRLSGALLSFLCMMKDQKTRRRVFDLHCKWGDYICEQAALEPIAHNDRPRAAAPRGDSKIRIGIMSGDLRNHAVAKFALPLFEHYDRRDFEIHCYSPYPGAPDKVQQRIIDLSTAFNRVHGLSHAEVAQKIADDGIDMAIELSGFTRFSELESLARRPAPVQIGWLGYPFTYGIPEIDYLLLDHKVAPAEGGHLRETPLLMPESWICFATADGGSGFGFVPEPIEPLTPAARTGKITFGTLNNPYKYSRTVVAVWARIVKSVPDSEFLFVRPEGASSRFRDSMTREFARHGIAADRVRFHVNEPDRHLVCYNDIDISLDTFPQTGGTTTCDSLWMGCPVVSLVGVELFERLSYSILVSAGAEDLCCFSRADYMKLAISLAGDIDRLNGLRQGLRPALLASPICQTERFVSSLQGVLKDVREKMIRA